MRRRTQVKVCVLALALLTVSCSQAPTGPNDSTWHFLSGHVEPLLFAPFRDGRKCWVYLPPGYATTDRRYPVLYFNDGEVVFDVDEGMHVNRVCEELIRGGQMEPIIVVAIANGPGNQRNIDYTPWPSPILKPNGGGDAYVRAIRDTLKPEIDRRFRTLTDPEHTAMAGMSLGGLISAYAAYAYGETFGRIAAFSPTYGYYDTAGVSMPEFAQRMGRSRHFIRFYQDTGWPHDNSVGAMESVALSQRFRSGIDFMSVTQAGAEHTNAAWTHRCPEMLKFLFPR